MKNIIISTKKINLTNELRFFIEKEINDKILPQIEENIKVKVLIQQNNNSFKTDIDVRIENLKINTSENNFNLDKSIKDAINKTANKLKKINKKIIRKNNIKTNKQVLKFCNDVFIVRKNQIIDEEFFKEKYELNNECNFEFVKTKRLDLKPMSPEEAVLQMNLTGHKFFLFLNCFTNEKCVVYKRDDNKYGIIE